MYNNFHVLHDIFLQKEQIFLKLQCSTSFVHNNKNFQKSEYSQFIKKKNSLENNKSLFLLRLNLILITIIIYQITPLIKNVS